MTLPATAQTQLLDAQRLEVYGGFQRRHASGTDFLASGGSGKVAAAAGAIVIPHSGTWHVWVQSRSLPAESEAARRFSLRLGTQTVAKLFGGHRLSDHLQFVWEDGGTTDLAQGPLLVALGEQNSGNAQCSRILLTDAIQQASPQALQRQAVQAELVPLTRSNVHRAAEMSSVALVPKAKPEAVLANERVRLSFLPGSVEGQRRAVLQRIEVRSGDGWKALPTATGGDSYRVLYRPAASKPHLVSSGQFPLWDSAFAPRVDLSMNGATLHSTEGPPTGPWLAGQLSQMRPVTAKQLDGETVELSFPPLPTGTLTARWRLVAGQSSASVTMSFQMMQPGYLSLGYHGAVEEEPEKLDFLMLGYLYLGHRFPAEAVTVPSDHTPTPAALVTRENLSYAVLAEPDVIPFAWPGPKKARYALGIRNESGKAEPLVYAPLLGSAQSLHPRPERATMQFRIWAQEGSWIEAYCAIVTQAFGLRDYRSPVSASLTDTMLNLQQLMQDDDKSGWDARAKGSWNIESRNTVMQPSPLTYLSYALLAGDEAFYRKYALPSLEFLLSRPEAHFAAAGGAGDYAHTALPLGGPNGMYTCATYASAFRMTMGATPAFADACFKKDGSLNTHPSHYAAFDDLVELYETTGDKKTLADAIASADRYIAENLTHLPTRDLGDEPFVNVTFTPDWEGLLRLYEATHEPRFLQAARQAAYWLMATVWTQPSIPAGNVTVPSRESSGNVPFVWWKGDHRFRLGFLDRFEPAGSIAPKLPEIAVPQASVPAWQVSNVGLGLEQPSTYVQANGNNNIMMSIWAPNLLRLAAHTGDELPRTYARNETIGRFANYPGYYLSLFDNVHQSADYPLRGPDLTYIYYHHIAPFAAYVQDYIFTDAEIRSEGQFRFPAARQFGYVWFDSRLRGFAPGTVYGEPAWPWISSTAAVGDNKNVDLVLAHNGQALYIALMNQTASPQHVNVRLDERMLLGRSSSSLRLWLDNKAQPEPTLRRSDLQLDFAANQFAVVAIDGLTLHVPGHETMPTVAPLRVAPNLAWTTRAVAGSNLQASGTLINVPQFHSRELYVYVHANAAQCSGATLLYRTSESAAERSVTVDQFPCEFSVPLPFDGGAVEWHVQDLHAPSQRSTMK